MDRRLFFLSLLALTPTTALAWSQAPLSLALIPHAQRVGSARLIVMLMPVMDVTLFSPQGHWHDDLPFALRLDYLRPLEGSGMARRATSEMRKLTNIDDHRLKLWQAQMAAIFPDVRSGDNMTALRTSDGATLFFKDEHQIGAIYDRGFGKLFFDICLSPKTSQPTLRRQLLGEV